MISRRIRRKYQTGGIIPDMRGAQTLGQPMQVQQRVNPVVYDPNPVFQAQRNRQDSMRTAISQANLNRNERLDAWRKEVDQRDFLDNKLTALRESYKAGQDNLTKLDLNIPEQMAMSRGLRDQLENINKQSASILTDNSLTPAERSVKLNEQISKAQSIFSSPEYVKAVQNNTLTSQVYDGIAKASQNGNFLIDYDAANHNIDLARQLQKGEIDRGTFFTGLKNFTLDPKEVDSWESKIDKYITDSIDPDKAATNWETYRDDDDFLIFKEKFTVPDIEDQIDVVVDMYKNNPQWMKIQEARGNRGFLDENGLINDEKLRAHARRKIELLRGSLAAQGKDITTNIKTVNRPNRTTGSGTATERQRQNIQSELEAAGYEVTMPSILGEALSAPDIIQVYKSDISDYEDPADIRFKRRVDMAIREVPDTPTPQTGTQNNDQGVIFDPTRNTNNVIDLSESENPAYESVERHESSGGANLINPNDVGQATVGPMQYRGELGEQFLSTLGIEGYDLTRPMTESEQSSLQREFNNLGKDFIMKKSREFFETNMLPDTMNIIEKEAPSLSSITENMSDAVKLPIVSMAINHSPRGQRQIMRNVDQMLRGIENPTQEDIINAIQYSRARYVDSLDLPDQTKEQLINRYSSEYNSAVALSGEQPRERVSQPDVEQTPSFNQRLDKLTELKKELEEENSFNDEELNKAIDRVDIEIEKQKKSIESTKESIEKIDSLGNNESTEIDIGLKRYVTAPGMIGGAVAPVLPKIEKSEKGEWYRITVMGKIVAPKITREQLDKWLAENTGQSLQDVMSVKEDKKNTTGSIRTRPMSKEPSVVSDYYN